MTNTQFTEVMQALAGIDAQLGRIADACERANARLRAEGVGSLESQAKADASTYATLGVTPENAAHVLLDQGDAGPVEVKRRGKRGGKR